MTDPALKRDLPGLIEDVVFKRGQDTIQRAVRYMLLGVGYTDEEVSQYVEMWMERYNQGEDKIPESDIRRPYRINLRAIVRAKHNAHITVLKTPWEIYDVEKSGSGVDIIRCDTEVLVTATSAAAAAATAKDIAPSMDLDGYEVSYVDFWTDEKIDIVLIEPSHNSHNQT